MVHFFSDKEDLKQKLAGLIETYSSVFILCDENTEKHCLPLIVPALKKQYSIIVIASGERNKNIETCINIWNDLTDSTTDRKSVLINLGGGVICDMGGFTASCYKRGIDFINIPTTLLAMVDASVGGKTGVDFNGIKNQIGLFSEARNVLICSKFLETLDERQMRSGLAEVVKHYLIADEQAFMDFAGSDQNNFVPDIGLIKKAVAIKSAIVEADPLEKSVRKKLNFGHTIGHALESMAMRGDAPLLHGEAVAFGMAIEVFIAAYKQLIYEKRAELVAYVLHDTFGLQSIPEEMSDQIVALALQDKKNENGVIRMALIDDIGSCVTDIEVNTEEIRKAIVYFNKSMDWYNK